MERKFRSLYIAVLAIIGVGLLGTVLVPKAHADVWDQKGTVTVHKISTTQPASRPGPQQFTLAFRNLPHAASPSVVAGIVGLGFLSLSGLISLFAKKST